MWDERHENHLVEFWPVSLLSFNFTTLSQIRITSCNSSEISTNSRLTYQSLCLTHNEKQTLISIWNIRLNDLAFVRRSPINCMWWIFFVSELFYFNQNSSPYVLHRLYQYVRIWNNTNAQKLLSDDNCHNLNYCHLWTTLFSMTVILQTIIWLREFEFWWHFAWLRGEWKSFIIFSTSRKCDIYKATRRKHLITEELPDFSCCYLQCKHS